MNNAKVILLFVLTKQSNTFIRTNLYKKKGDTPKDAATVFLGPQKEFTIIIIPTGLIQACMSNYLSNPLKAFCIPARLTSSDG